MAENNESNYVQFLVDTKNSRQYAMHYDADGGVTKIDVIARSPLEQTLKASEVIFALDDEYRFTDDRHVSVELYQFTIDDQGRPGKIGGKGGNVKSCLVTYELKVGYNEMRDPIYAFELTQESRQELAAAGFEVPRLPTQLIGRLQADAAGNAVMPNGGNRALSLVPHHPGGALLARANAKTSLTPAFTPVAQPPRRALKVKDADIEEVIRQYCVDLSADAKAGRLDPVVGRDKEITQALKVLTRRKQSSLCFTGEAGVGKSAMFAGVAQRLADDQDLPGSLQNARVLVLDLQAMAAGTKYRGMFEERLKPLVDGLAEREGVLGGRKIILAIDELHSQLTSGSAEGGGDAGNMMKPFLTAKGISVMGTTTDEEYRKHIEKDGALASRFEKLRLDSPDVEATVTILKKLWPMTKTHNNLAEDLKEEEYRYIVTMTNRYAPQEAQPRKSEKVMNMAAASAELEHRDTISRADIIAAVAQMSNLDSDFLNQSDYDRFLKMETELPKEILGQPGIQRVTDGLIGSRSGLVDPKQPWGCFVLQGPTGTGKTELCKAMARYLFGTEEAMIKLDMSEFSEKHTVSRLTGAPPGYVGFEDSEPALTEKVKNRPFSIILLDEIEKAHPDVFNIFLTILNDGKMTDNHGKEVLFNNTIIVMTTNAGAAAVTEKLEGNSGISMGARKVAAEKTEEELQKIYEAARQIKNGGPFRPEMINRIEELGGFVTFLPLKPEVISKLAVREISKISSRLADPAGANLPGLTIEISEPVTQQLAKEGYNSAMGARPLRKVVREKIANPLGKWLMNPEVKAKIQEMVAADGSAKIIINSLDDFTPELTKVAPANDNAAKKAKAKKAATPQI